MLPYILSDIRSSCSAWTVGVVSRILSTTSGSWLPSSALSIMKRASWNLGNLSDRNSSRTLVTWMFLEIQKGIVNYSMKGCLKGKGSLLFCISDSFHDRSPFFYKVWGIKRRQHLTVFVVFKQPFNAVCVGFIRPVHKGALLRVRYWQMFLWMKTVTSVRSVQNENWETWYL